MLSVKKNSLAVIFKKFYRIKDHAQVFFSCGLDDFFDVQKPAFPEKRYDLSSGVQYFYKRLVFAGFGSRMACRAESCKLSVFQF
jgi:hypothetical protein